uniref:CCR4-NOT transcription complex subunit 2 n=1 Tax=Takifugu rubripes TaxID=31033 RepID=A0A674MUW9_TAKRU
MFGANRKKFLEGGIESEYGDDSSLYYSQQSMFPPHRSDKDMLASSSASSTAQLSQLGASLYGPQSALGFPMRSLNSGAASQLSRSALNPSASHANTPGAGTMHTPPSPSRYSGLVGGERGGGSAGVGAGRSSSIGSPSRGSPSIIGMPKQQQARQPFTINSENVTSLDLSDFPALADRSRRDGGSNPAPLPNPLAGRAPYVGMVTKPSSEQSQDFSIHNEDFPALPGPNYQIKDATSSSEDKTNLNSSGKPASNSEGPKFPGDKSSAPSNNNQKKGIQVLPDGRVTNIPVGMVTDQFGMIGLLTFIRAAETDPGMVHLALGSDLTTLGLNLNSPENLYPKFASPWASSPCRPQDIDFHVPSEYLTNIHIRDKLAAIKLSRYGEDLLFYLYYMNGGDLLQLLATVELFNRDWRYHKEERVWITRAPGMEPTLKTNSYERGTYYFFDCLNWRKVAKEFHLEYDKLDERPHVPSTFNYNPAQQAF